ncbi:ATPase AAA-type core [Macrophomina phaseolina MS6]|uniref:ATPase AAA-type core n=1 Tax=Macrophomina phaseolina (strain MS6) TaxID=1126212 RepID=K2RWU3_MACPH|nr:ATPase AAA-type core [Macrophomina phaseolina MS6]
MALPEAGRRLSGKEPPFLSSVVESVEHLWLCLLICPSRGLAQKLKIRLGHVYLNGTLIEIHTEALFSKFFGESGKIVGQIFDRIEALADLDDETLLCIMIDEVETLVAPRENSAFGGEVADAMRVTNGVLTALDRLRNRPNVIVLCTSNITDAIDSAFMDRADVIQLVPDPGPDAVYGILRSSFNELIKQGILTSTAVCEPHESSSVTNDTDTDNNHDSTLQDPALFPSVGIVELMAAEDSSAMKLLNISKQCLGMSGRKLRKLPSKAVGLYTYSDQPSVEEVLEALQKTADKEKSVKTG